MNILLSNQARSASRNGLLEPIYLHALFQHIFALGKTKCLTAQAFDMCTQCQVVPLYLVGTILKNLMDWIGYQRRIDIKPIGIYPLWKKIQNSRCYFLNVLFRSSADAEIDDFACAFVDGIDNPALIRLIPTVGAQLVHLIRLPYLLIDRLFDSSGDAYYKPLHARFGNFQQPTDGTNAASFVAELYHPVVFLLRNTGLGVRLLLCFFATFTLISLHFFNLPSLYTISSTV